MNILFIAQRVPFPANKGEKIRSLNQAKYLADLGHKIHVVSPIEDNSEIAFTKQLSALNNFSCEYAPLSAKPLRLLAGLLKNESLSVANFYCKALQTTIDNALSTQTFDAIFCTSSAVAKYVFKSNVINILPKMPKLIMDYMDLDSDKWQQYADKTSWPMKYIYLREAKLVGKYEQKIQQHFDACFFIADAEVDLFKQKTGSSSNVYTLGNGMNTDEFYPGKSPATNSAPKFIFTGVMDYKPNVDAVVWFVENCWENIITKYPNAEFIIAGMNPNASVMQLEKYQGITITGFVDEILPFYHQADYFVAPFRLARGVQNKVLQAFACGLPVISTPMGAEGIDCRDDEHILLASTPEEFLEKIVILEEQPAVKQQIAASALTLIKDHYSWQGKLAPLREIINA